MKEPTVIIGAISEVVKAIIPTLIIFGLIKWTPEQIAQVMLLLGVVVGAINIVLTRSQVVATPAVNDLIQTAVSMPAGTPVEVVKTVQAEKDSK